jgi:endonuclease/exonuclease/phosphatase family metal-dependent hydrolase
VGLLLRTWNLFHGNSVPPQRRAYLEQMVRLATADEPDLLLLQEVPVWALGHLAAWSEMEALGEVAQPPRIGPIPFSAELGRLLTDLNHGVLRSAFTGQANAILVGPRLQVLARDRIVLNAKDFRRAKARELQLGLREQVAWARERRIAQAVRVRREDGRTLDVLNLHSTSYSVDTRLADAEAIRAVELVERLAEPHDPIVLAGDFNIRVASSQALPQLEVSGYRRVGGAVVDHVLVRGLETGPLEHWPDERRTLDGRLLSDHAPLEVTIE